jgi:hypothetical protein
MSNVLIRPSSGVLEFNAGLAGGNSLQPLTGAARLTYDSFGGINLLSYASGSTGLDRFSVEGSQGKLFTITDQISGSLFSVNDVGGLPILEVFDNSAIIAGGFNAKDFIISGNKIGIGAYPDTGYKLYITGNVNVDGDVRTSGLVLATSNALNASGSNLVSTINNLSGAFNSTGISLKSDITNLANSTNTFLRLDTTTQSIAGNKTFLGNVVIQNLTVTGTQSIASSSDLTIASNYIVINSGDQGANGISLLSGGLRIDRGTGVAYPDAVLQYNENQNRFEFGVEGSLSGIAPIETLNTTISNLATTGNTLSTLISLMSGSFNNSGTNVVRSINALSGSLNTSGSNLTNSINSLSGSLNQSGINLSINTSNVQTNLDLTGFNLIELLRTGYLNLTSNQEITGVKNFITPPTINGLTIVTSNNIGDQQNLVLQTGDQNISGIKTFFSALSAPNLVYNTGNQNVTGLKNFQVQPTLNGAPLLVSGTYGSVDIETARVDITDGSIEQGIRFLKNYGANTKPIVVSNLYYTGLNDEIIAHQIQNVTSTGFTVSLSRPATGYSVNYWAMENTGASFLALGARTSVFAQRNNLQTGTTSQFITFTNTSLVNPPVLSLTLEDRNPIPTENFFLFKATGINPTGFSLYLSEPIPSGHTGYFLHTQVTP